MLEDHKRTGAYYAAVMQNRAQFVGKTVLDVGTGSGILALFAAKAGARKVYAVEATDMAKHARRLVEANGVRPTPLLCVAILCWSSIRMVSLCSVSDAIRKYCSAYLMMSLDGCSSQHKLVCCHCVMEPGIVPIMLSVP